MYNAAKATDNIGGTRMMEKLSRTNKVAVYDIGIIIDFNDSDSQPNFHINMQQKITIDRTNAASITYDIISKA